MYSIRDYISNTGGGADGNHVAMAGWFWWCWNANSGDTGGLVCNLCPKNEKYEGINVCNMWNGQGNLVAWQGIPFGLGLNCSFAETLQHVGFVSTGT